MYSALYLFQRLKGLKKIEMLPKVNQLNYELCNSRKRKLKTNPSACGFGQHFQNLGHFKLLQNDPDTGRIFSQPPS